MQVSKNRKELWLTAAELQYIDYSSKYFGVDKTTTMRILMRLGMYQVLKQAEDLPLTRHLTEIQKIVDEI